jgi:hypothetical protein
MKNFSLKKAAPHIIAVAVILIISIIFCQPAFQGLKLEQHDMVAGRGMIKNSLDHQEKYGTLPLWNTHMFSGMPNFQILYTWDNPMLNIGKVMGLGLPEPANMFFIAAIAFYILGLCFGLNPYIALFSALSYAYSSYNPQIINAGHMTKMMALAYAPGVIAGLKLLFDRKYWIGLIIMTVYTSQHITSNHPQITYYLFIICLVMSVVYAINWLKQKEFKHTLCVLALSMVAAMISIGNAAPLLMNTVEYAKYTMRGGKNIEVKDNQVVKTKTTGLDYDYASMWSIKVPEIVTIFMPNAYGTGSSNTLPEDSKFIESLENENIPVENAQQLAAQLPAYWGGLESVVGPNYLGIIAFLLALLGVLFLKDKNAVWIGISLLAGATLAFGKYLPSINEMIFNTVPYYNKFRAPSMSLVMIQLLIPLAAGLFLNKFSEGAFGQIDKSFLKKMGYGLGGLILVASLIYLLNDYTSPFVDNQLKEYFSKNEAGGKNMSSIVLNAIQDQRKATFGSSLLVALICCLALFSVLFLYAKKFINATILISLILIGNTGDLLVSGSKYLGSEIYVDEEELIAKNFTLSEADKVILQDNDPHFRVYNASGDAFSETRTSYFHRSIGGYHAAKLRNYQDIIETKFNGQLSMNVLNMLDTRYVIIPSNTQNAGPQLQKNDQALGAVWLVDSLVPVADLAKELKAIDSINPLSTAVISTGKFTQITSYKKDSSAKISLVKYDNDTIRYSFQANEKQFAVFSEVYYPAGWNAYVDGKKTEFEKVNYFLRGMEIEPGNHEIQFIFEPSTYVTSSRIANISGWAFYIIIIGGLSMLYLSKRKRSVA